MLCAAMNDRNRSANSRPANIMEAFWDRMKDEALQWAASNRPLPTRDECRQIGKIEIEILPKHFSLPEAIRAFYAGEFHGMIVVRRETIAEP